MKTEEKILKFIPKKVYFGDKFKFYNSTEKKKD